VPKDVKSVKLNVKEIISKVKKLNKGVNHKVISLTGGEPLLQDRFLEELLPKLKELKFKIYLETNATLLENLKTLLKYIDVVAADIKLPSVAKEKPRWKVHSDFIRVARNKNIFVKTVVSRRLKTRDFKKAVSLVRKIDPAIPFIIQPVIKGKVAQINTERLHRLQCYALRFLETALVIPQTHKILGAR